MIVIVDAWLLRLHAKKFASVHNCPGWRVFQVMNVEEDQSAKLSRRSGMICCRNYLVRSWSLQKGWTPRRLGVSKLHRWKCPRGEEQLLEWLWSDGVFWLLRHVSLSCERQILTATMDEMRKLHMVATKFLYSLVHYKQLQPKKWKACGLRWKARERH